VKLTIIGCSGSVPGPAAPAPCYLVEADDAQGHDQLDRVGNSCTKAW